VIEGAGRRSARVGEPAVFTVAARDAHGNACGGALAAELPLAVLINSASAVVEAEVTDTGRGLYVVTFTPKQAGLYRLEVACNGCPLGHSPYALTVHPRADAGTSDAVDAAHADEHGARAAAAAAAAAAAVAAEDPVASAPPAPDLARRWAKIAQEARTRPAASCAARACLHACVRALALTKSTWHRLCVSRRFATWMAPRMASTRRRRFTKRRKSGTRPT
jgi:hypothetical protein